MYNYIFEVRENPIPAEEWTCAESIDCDNPFRAQTDYVEDVLSGDRNTTIDVFLQSLYEKCGWRMKYSISEGDCWFCFDDEFNFAYFSKQYNQFVSAQTELSSITSFENFVNGGVRSVIEALETAFNTMYDDCVMTDGENINTLDEFIRRARAGQKYYIGGVMAYHW